MQCWVGVTYSFQYSTKIFSTQTIGKDFEKKWGDDDVFGQQEYKQFLLCWNF